MNIIEQIQNQYKENGSLAVLIRHADRDKIPEGSFGNEIPINAQGAENAVSFGVKLRDFKINKIFTSPVKRCIQTAVQIVNGYGKYTQIVESKALGEPGLHVCDEKLAGQFCLEYGVRQTYQKIITQEIVPGFINCEDLKHTMMSFLSQNTVPNGITLFISHDLLITMFDFALNKTIYTPENWVAFLSGIVLPIKKYEELP